MKRIRLTILLMFFCMLTFSQSINLIDFNSSDSYAPGSGVSVHINPTGIFELSANSFVLELSAPGGDFTNPTVLGTVNDFYTPLINGVLPADLSAGQYKLRIRSSHPALSVETDLFIVENSSFDSVLTITSGIQSNTNFTECLNDGSNVTNPYAGSMNQNYNSLTSSMPSTYKFFTVNPSDSSNSISVNLYNIESGATTSISPFSGNVYQIPGNLAVGTYNFEVEETDSEGNISVFSYTFLFHTSTTVLGNASSETVCVGEEVTFTIDISDLGITNNYMGSYYVINFGDGTAPLTYTQAELLALYSATPAEPITHIFNQPSCNANGSSSFEVSKKLYNKGVVTTGSSPQCDTYVQNGLGTVKEIATAESPEAEFNLNPEQCQNEDIEALNATIPGSYPTANGSCAGDVILEWEVKKPSFADFLPAFLLNPSWLVNDDLIIPASDVDEIGCWQIKLIARNPAGCLQEDFEIKTVNIEDIPDADFNEIGDICLNEQITLTDASNIIQATCDPVLPNETPTYVWTVSPDSGYNLESDDDGNLTTLNSQNPEITFTDIGTYTVSLTVTTACGSDTHSEQFNVLGDPTVEFPISTFTDCSLSSLEIDFSSEISPTYSAGFLAPTDYSWTISGSGITSSDYTFLNGTTNSDEFPEISLNTFGTFLITVTVGSNCDNPSSDTVSITLSQTPTITNDTNSQEVCSNEASSQFDFESDVTGTTYSWIATQNENLNGYDESGITAFIPSQSISNLTNVEQELVYTIIPDADGCIGDSFEYMITVQPTPVIADKEITICDGDTFEILPTDDSPTEIVPLGTTYSWSSPMSDPVGVATGGLSGTNEISISQLLSNSTDFPATLTYTVTPIVGTDGCEGNPFDVVVTVNPTVGINTVPSQILCNGENTLDIDFTSVLDENNENLDQGVITYSWVNDNPGIGLPSSGIGDIASFVANNSTIAQIEGNITVTSVYTFNDISCEGESTTFKIIVNPSPQVVFSEDNQYITSGETTASVDLTSPTSGVTFAWTAVADNGITGLTTTSGTTLIPEETLFNNTTDPLTVIYTAVASGNIGFNCEGLPYYHVVTVNPKAQVNPVDDQTVCNEEELLIEFTTNINGGNMTYSWTNDNSAIGLSNAGTGNIDIIATNTTDAPISGTIVVTPSFENGGDINVGDPITFEITVNPTGQVNSVGNQIVSNGFDTSLVEFSTTNVNGNTTFSWTNDLTSIGLAASGTGDIPVFTAINTGTSPVVATITVTPTFENGGVSCTGPATPFEITVNPTAQVNPDIDIVVSDGDEITIPFSTINTGGTTTYTWTNSDDTTGLELSGNSDIGFTATNTGTSPVTTTVIVTPTFENGGNSNSGPTETFTITVNPPAQVNPINDIVICNLDEVDDIIFSTQNTGGTTTYEWSNNNISISNNELAASGSTSMINAFTATNSSLTAQTATIEVTPTFTFEGNSNVGTSIEFTITVNPDATLVQPQNYVFCNGDITELISFETLNTDGDVSFDWTNDNPDTGLTETAGDGDVPVFNVTNNTNEPIVSTIVVTPTYTNNGISCPGESKEFTITVNPSAQVNEIENIEICDGEATDPIIFTTDNLGDLSVTTYSWVNDAPDVFGLGESGDGTIDTFTAINAGTSPLTATITVTPTYSNLGLDCLGEAEIFTITVHPGAQVNQIDDEFYCNGDLTELIEFTTTNEEGTTEYNWTNSNESIGLPATGTGNIEPFEIINTSTTAQTATITVTPTYTNNGIICEGNPEDFVISVNPSAQVNDVSVNDTVLCNSDFTPVYFFETLNTDGLTSYNWTNDNTEIGLSDSGQGGIPSFQAINTTDSTIFATITVTPSYDNNGIVCTGESSSFTISVNPSPEMNVVEDIFLCSNEITSIIDFSTSNTDGETTYQWTNDNTSIGLPESGNGDIPSFTALNSGLITQVANISVTPTYTYEGNTCIGLPQTFTISVSSEIIIVGDVTNAYDCENPNSGSINVTTSGGYGDYEFLWNTGEDTEDLSNIGPGEYTLTVTDLHDCSSTSEAFIVIRQEDLTVDLSSVVVPYCENNLVTQENSISISGGFPPYTVNWSGGAVDISDNTFMTAYQNGVYNVLVTDQIGCQVNTEIIIDFDEIGEPSFSYDSNGNIDCGISVYNELEFINTSSGDYISVSWDFGDGSSIVSGDMVTHQYLNPGEYTVTQTVEYGYGCIDTYSEQIEVTDGYDIVLPTAFSPNNDGINDTMRPVYACVNSIEMSIYDTFGSLIYFESNLELNGWDGSLNGKLAENGNYLIVVKGTTIYNEEINLRGVFVLLR